MQLAVTRHLIALLATREGMELEAAAPVHVLETVLRADTPRLRRLRALLHTTVLPATLDGTELVAATPAHVQETVLRADTRHWRKSLDQLQMTALLVQWAST